MLADQVAVGPDRREDRGVVAGMSATPAGRACSARGFLASLEEPPRAGDRVKLGKVEALRYEGLEPKGFGGRALTVFAAPTGGGVATIACFAPPGGGAAFRADCERVAGTLAVEGETAFPRRRRHAVRRGPQPRRRRARQAPQGRPRRARRGAHAGRRSARPPRRSPTPTRSPAPTSAGSKAGPATAPAQAGIERALGNAAAAYRRLAGAPHAGRRSAARPPACRARRPA